MRTFLAFLLAFVIPAAARAATIMVTPQDSYQKIEAANPGDEVVLAPGTYAFRVHLTKKGTPQQPIVIRAQDPNNKPVVDFGSTLVENAPGSYTAGDRGRGCWQISGGTNYRLESIVFQNCRTASRNSAGIRYYNAASVAIKDCLFKSNDNGLTGGTGDSSAVVEWSVFDSNGNTMASAPTHNIYIYGGTYTMRYSYLHDPTQGQNFHVRAHDSTIEYNWIARPKSYSGDLMTDDDCNANCVQKMLLRGNLIIQGMPNNGSQIVAVFNDNGVSGVNMAVTLLWNTVVVSTQNGRTVHLANSDGTQMTAVLHDNLISGGPNPVLVDSANNGMVSGSNNWFPTGTPVTPLTGSVFGMNPFKNPAMKDYTLAMGSTAIGAANMGVMGAPDREYFRDEVMARMYRARMSVKDIGAFESTTSGMGIGPYGMMIPMQDGGAGDGGTTIPDGGGMPGSDGGGGDPDGGPNGVTPGMSGGCGCDTSPETARSGWPALLALLALRRRR